MEGLCCTPLIEGNRLWFVTSRCEVRCLDTAGDADNEAKVIWTLDMMKDLGVSPHNMSACSVTTAGDTLFVCTSNGVDVEHNYIPAPDAPSFMALDKNTGKILWTDKSPGSNILHGQWSSPSYAVLGGQPQVIFGGGDGWLYSFDPGRRRQRQLEATLEIRLQSENSALHARPHRHAQPPHRFAGDLRRQGLRRRR